MDVVDTQDKQAQWQSITIAKDIGVNENTIMELDTMLTTINADLPLGFGFTSDQHCEKRRRDRRQDRQQIRDRGQERTRNARHESQMGDYHRTQ